MKEWEEKRVQKKLRKEKIRLFISDKECIIGQFDLNNNFIRTFKNCTQASNALNKIKCSTNIQNVCEGVRGYSFGYKWKYIDANTGQIYDPTSFS